jgi:hypothetical protein
VCVVYSWLLLVLIGVFVVLILMSLFLGQSFVVVVSFSSGEFSLGLFRFGLMVLYSIVIVFFSVCVIILAVRVVVTLIVLLLGPVRVVFISPCSGLMIVLVLALVITGAFEGFLSVLMSALGVGVVCLGLVGLLARLLVRFLAVVIAVFVVPLHIKSRIIIIKMQSSDNGPMTPLKNSHLLPSPSQPS